MSLHEHKAVFGENFSVQRTGAEKFGRASLLQLNRERLLRTHTLRHPQASMSSAGASVLELAGEQPVLLPASESPVAPTPSTRRRSGAQSARRPQSARSWNSATSALVLYVSPADSAATRSSTSPAGGEADTSRRLAATRVRLSAARSSPCAASMASSAASRSPDAANASTARFRARRDEA